MAVASVNGQAHKRRESYVTNYRFHSHDVLLLCLYKTGSHVLWCYIRDGKTECLVT